MDTEIDLWIGEDIRDGGDKVPLLKTMYHCMEGSRTIETVKTKMTHNTVILIYGHAVKN